MTELDTTAEYWGNQEDWKMGNGLHWTEIPEVIRRLNQKASGQPEIDWEQYSLSTHLKGRLPLSKCLSLGCGKGALERRLAQLDAFSSCDAFDLAPASIERAKRLAADQGYANINYYIQDINTLLLPAQEYDVVWIHGAMHHFTRLEFICEQIQRTLKPEGQLIINEYVGASRFQFPKRQREILNAVYHLLPNKYRHISSPAIDQTISRSPIRMGARWTFFRILDKVRDKNLLSTLHRRWQLWKGIRAGKGIDYEDIPLPTLRDVTSTDPSEAIRSGEILRNIQDYFSLIELKELGGSLLQFLLSGIAANFNDNDLDSVKLLNLLFQIEDVLISSGDLTSDFIYLVARPK